VEIPIAADAGAGLSVELRRDLDLPAVDAAALDTLIDSRPETGVFLSRAWLSGFFAEPPAGFEPAVVLLRQGPALRALAPIGVRRAMTGVTVRLLGGGVGSDRVDLLAARGFEALASDTFLSWVRDAFGRRTFTLELRDVPSDSPLWGATHRAGLERTLHYALHPREINTLPYLSLTESRGTTMASGPPAANVRSLEKHRRWLDRRCRVRFELLSDAADVLDAFDTLARFLHARWRGQPEGSVLDNPRTFRFHQHVLPQLLSEGRLRMIRVTADDRPVGVYYGLASARWWGYYLAGYDREWAGRIRIGQITLAGAIDAATDAGAVEFDFLKGADRHKYFWPVRERATLDADLYSAGSGPQIRRATRATREAAAALAKSARSLLSTDAHGTHSTIR
jgi:CelD/BcsL family acetyltransferase involved in cellulose biosynthesis